MRNSKMKAALLCASALLAAAACGNDLTGPSPAVVAYGVTISVDLNGGCIVGGCDPTGDARTHLALVTVTNTGTTTAYLSACGNSAAIDEQQFVDGQWTYVGPAIACPVTPGPIPLAAGASLRSNWWFATGRRRLVVGVAGDAPLTNVTLDASAGFDVP